MSKIIISVIISINFVSCVVNYDYKETIILSKDDKELITEIFGENTLKNVEYNIINGEINEKNIYGEYYNSTNTIVIDNNKISKNNYISFQEILVHEVTHYYQYRVLYIDIKKDAERYIYYMNDLENENAEIQAVVISDYMKVYKKNLEPSHSGFTYGYEDELKNGYLKNFAYNMGLGK